MNREDFPMRLLKEKVAIIDGASEIIQPLLFIVFFLGVGLYFVVQGLFVIHDDSIVKIGLIALGVGSAIVLLYGWNATFNFVTHFGRWGGLVSEGPIAPGDTFRFRFEQKFRLNMEIESVGVYLVFRETMISVSGGVQYTKTLDRLVQEYSYAGGRFKAGEVMTQECVFQIPERAMGVRSGLPGEEAPEIRTSWWVKVRIVPAAPKRKEVLEARLSPFAPPNKKFMVLGPDDDDFWREFEIEVQGEGAAPEGQDKLFDVYLVTRGYFTYPERDRAVREFVPHLDSYQITSLTAYGKDRLLRERVSAQEAQEMKERLAALDVDVIVRPSG